MDWIIQAEREAVDKVRAELAKPMPEGQNDVGRADHFDPWELFPCLYGTYSDDFDGMALLVLRNIQFAAEGRWDDQDRSEGLAHQMFREMLCTANLCDYGTSPRGCFATEPFKEVLPELIAKWETFSQVHWNDRLPVAQLDRA